MSVAYFTSQYPAVSHTFIRREVEALRAQGIEVHTFSVRPPTSLADPADAREFEATNYLLPMKVTRLLRAHLKHALLRPGRYVRALISALRHRAPGLRSLVWSLFYFAEAIVLADELERRGIRHLHSHFANVAGSVGYIASRFLGIGWSITLHGDMDFDYPARLLLDAKAAWARFIVCVSYFGRAQAMRVIRREYWDKLIVVRCGVDLGRFTRGERAVRRARPRIVSVGRLSPEKGQLGLIQAFAGLGELGIDAELRIVGGGPLEAALKREITRLGLEERCILLGSRTEAEVAAELAGADVFALSSFLEGLPVVLMEALAMELPVVAPGVAGIPELVVPEQTGLLFAPSDWTALRDQLARLLADAELGSRLAAAGRRRVEAEFDSYRAVAPLVARFRDAEPDAANESERTDRARHLPRPTAAAPIDSGQ